MSKTPEQVRADAARRARNCRARKRAANGGIAALESTLPEVETTRHLRTAPSTITVAPRATGEPLPPDDEPPLGQSDHPDYPEHALHPDDDGAEPNEAAAAVTAGKAKRAGRPKGAKNKERDDQGKPVKRAKGWLRKSLESTATVIAGLPASQLRDLARRVFEADGLPYLQELIVDTDAKDADRIRAVDMVAKIAVGYITPDVMNAEDAPELPPPMFTTTEGELPGGESLQMPDDQGADTGATEPSADGLEVAAKEEATGHIPYMSAG